MVAGPDAPPYRRAAGLADREAGVPMREDTIFRLASVTKPLVSAAAMRLVEEGALSLDAPVTRWLPDFRPRLPDGSAPEITIHHLLTHTAGLSYRFQEPADSAYHRLGVSDGSDQPGLTMEENLARIAAAPLAYAPGTEWLYSVSLDVLGAAMEKAAGASLPEVLARTVTEPLGMTDTAFRVTDPARLSVPYANAFGGPRVITDGMRLPLWEGAVLFDPSRIFNPASFPSGGGGMAGTAGDIFRFMEAIREGGAPILRPDTVAAMLRNQVGERMAVRRPGWGFGYGWSVLTDPAAGNTQQTPGTIQWGGVYGHSWFVDPARELTVVALTNTTFEGMVGQFVLDLRAAVYGTA